MDNNKNSLTLLSDGVKIQGRYYTVSNGFISKEDGSVLIPYKDLLSVDYVKRRSKRIMYIVLVLGFLLMLVLSGVRSRLERTIETLNIEDLQSTYKILDNISNSIQRGDAGQFYEKAKAVVTGIIILASIVCLFCLIYLFSARRFVEITSMRGTYRIVVHRGDKEFANIVSQLQMRISRN